MPQLGSQPYDDSLDSKDTNSNPYMFAAQQQHTQQPLYSPLSHDSPQSWPPYDQSLLPPFQSQPLPYRGPAPYPAPRLASPHNTSGGGHTATNSSRLSLAGSLDPATGIFYRTPEHPRLRTAQACEKCRTRKAKCSGEHPSCKRCINRGLACEYAKEGRVRGPNKIKNAGVGTSSLKNTNASAAADLEQQGRTPSANGSVSSIEQGGSSSSYAGDRSKTREHNISSDDGSPVSPPLPHSGSFHQHSPSRMGFIPVSHQASPRGSSLSQELYAVSSISSSGQSPRHDSLTPTSVGLGEHRTSRPRPPNLSLASSNQWRQEAMDVGHGWMNHSGVEMGPNINSGPGLDYREQQRGQYEPQRLIQQQRQQQQRFIQDPRRYDLQKRQHMLQQQQGVPNGLEFRYQMPVMNHSSSLSMLPPQPERQRQPANSGMEAYRPPFQVYAQIGEYAQQRGMEFQQGMYPVQPQVYQEHLVSIEMGQEGDQQGVSMALDATEQGLHPSLSRIQKSGEQVSNGGAGEENFTANCPLLDEVQDAGTGDVDRARSSSETSRIGRARSSSVRSTLSLESPISERRANESPLGSFNSGPGPIEETEESWTSTPDTDGQADNSFCPKEQGRERYTSFADFFGGFGGVALDAGTLSELSWMQGGGAYDNWQRLPYADSGFPLAVSQDSPLDTPSPFDSSGCSIASLSPFESTLYFSPARQLEEPDATPGSPIGSPEGGLNGVSDSRWEESCGGIVESDGADGVRVNGESDSGMDELSMVGESGSMMG